MSSNQPAQPFIELYENTYVRTIWNVLFKTFDVMAWMYRQPGKPWDIGYRFRFYVDDKAFDSEDRKTGWRITPRSAEPSEAELAEMAKAFDLMFAALVDRERDRGDDSGVVHRLDCNCTGPVAGALIEQAPWNHIIPGRADAPGKRPGGKA